MHTLTVANAPANVRRSIRRTLQHNVERRSECPYCAALGRPQSLARSERHDLPCKSDKYVKQTFRNCHHTHALRVAE